MSQHAMIGLIESLEGTIRNLEAFRHGMGHYYESTNYSDSRLSTKKIGA